MLKVLMLLRHMKPKLKQTYSSTWRKLVSLSVMTLAVLFVVGASVVPHVNADQFDQQIRALQQENQTNLNAVATLQSQARSYQDAIAVLRAQISQLQAEIGYNRGQQALLQAQIEANEKELQRQRKLLGADLKAMYVDGDISTIEMLATSKNLSEFIDREAYRNAVQAKIQDTLKKITTLQATLQGQKQQVEVLLAEQQTRQAQQNASKAEQARLLTLNQNEQAEYNKKTKDNQNKIADLIAAQRRANCGGECRGLVYDPNNGYYPYANWPFSMNTAPGCVDGDGPDEWGYCTRQCVSYAAWAVKRSGRTPPKYYGNANNWENTALARGVPVYKINPSSADLARGVQTGGPQAGDVVISTAGTWGHAMYVESVLNGEIYVSQYNAGLDGRYSLQWRDAAPYYYLRFPE